MDTQVALTAAPAAPSFVLAVVAAVKRDDSTIKEVAAMFGIGLTFVKTMERQHRETSDLCPRSHGGGHVPRLANKHLKLLRAEIARSPDEDHPSATRPTRRARQLQRKHPDRQLRRTTGYQARTSTAHGFIRNPMPSKCRVRNVNFSRTSCTPADGSCLDLSPTSGGCSLINGICGWHRDVKLPLLIPVASQTITATFSATVF